MGTLAMDFRIGVKKPEDIVFCFNVISYVPMKIRAMSRTVTDDKSDINGNRNI